MTAMYGFYSFAFAVNVTSWQ